MLTTKADKYFSLFIRLRDTQDDGYCRCITCGRVMLPKEADCGHFIKRQHQATRFNEMNCAAQCKMCNAFEQGRDADFERALIERYGKDKVDLLKSQKNVTFKRSQVNLDLLAAQYKRMALDLSREKGIELW